MKTIKSRPKSSKRYKVTCACGQHNIGNLVKTPEFRKELYKFLKEELKLPESRITALQGTSNHVQMQNFTFC